MAIKPVPEGYHSVTPYLLVKGAAQLLEFVKEAFGAEQTVYAPMGEGRLHAEVRIGDSMVMMGDAGEMAPIPAMIYLYVDDADSVYLQALKAGGKSLQEPAVMFYGDRAAAVQDPLGNQWWIATHIEDVSAEEMERRRLAQMAAQ